MIRRLLPLAGLAVAAFVILFVLAGCASDDDPPPGPTEAQKTAEAIRQLDWCTSRYPTCAGRPIDAWFWNYLAEHPDGFRVEDEGR